MTGPVRGLILVVAAACAVAYGCRPHPGATPHPGLTQAQLESLEPSVRAELEEATRRARAQPDDPEAHGRLAMLLHAHSFLEAAASCYEHAQSLGPNDARWQRLDAHRAAEAGLEAEALEHALAAVGLDERSVPARSTLAHIQIRRGELEEARKHLRAALELDADDFATLDAMGNLEMQEGNFTDAVRWMELALRARPDDASVHYRAALAFARLGQTDRAEEHMEASQKAPARRPAITPPDEILTLRGRGARPALAEGTALLEQGRADDAVASLRDAVAMNPGSADAHNALGVALETTGNLERARAHYERAVALEPELAIVRKNLGVVLGRLARLDDAVDQLEIAVRLDPGQADAHVALGAALAAAGRGGEAVAAFQQAVTLDPQMARAHRELGVALGRTDRLADARDHLEKAVELEPDSGEAHHYLAVALHRLGLTTSALEHERRAIALAETSLSRELLGTAHYSLAMMLRDEEKLAEALAHFERALTYYPNDVDVLSELARTHHLHRNHAEAIELQSRVTRARPADAEGHYRLGIFLAANGDFDEARQAFESSVRAAPDFQPALQALERLDRSDSR